MSGAMELYNAADRQTDGRTDRQTDGQTDEWTDHDQTKNHMHGLCN
jgi:hypothetical protein